MAAEKKLGAVIVVVAVTVIRNHKQQYHVNQTHLMRCEDAHQWPQNHPDPYFSLKIERSDT